MGTRRASARTWDNRYPSGPVLCAAHGEKLTRRCGVAIGVSDASCLVAVCVVLDVMRCCVHPCQKKKKKKKKPWDFVLRLPRAGICSSNRLVEITCCNI